MRLIVAKFVPFLLKDDQEENWLSLCKDLQDQAKNDRNFLSEVIVTFPFPKDENPVKGMKI
jgi:hypothetical protein